MNDDVSLFELYLCDLDLMSPTDGASTPPHAFRGEPVPQDRALRDDLRLVRALRRVQPPAKEAHDAHARVATLLQEQMADSSHQGDAATLMEAASPSPIRFSRQRHPARAPRLARVALAAAALLLLVCVAGWRISTAAASALPGSPLYGVKRGEELLALDTAWSDQRRGAVLAVIADHRLAEMRSEAAKHDDGLVQSLAREFDSTMRQLISLTATMTARHEDTTDVASRLAYELHAEYTTLNTAVHNGDVILAQALIVTVQSEHAAIQNSHITLPPGVIGTGTPGLATPPAPPPTARPSPMPSHTPPTGPGNNNGHSNGNSNSNGHGSSSSSSSSSHSGDDAGASDKDQSSAANSPKCSDPSPCAHPQERDGFSH